MKSVGRRRNAPPRTTRWTRQKAHRPPQYSKSRVMLVRAHIRFRSCAVWTCGSASDEIAVKTAAERPWHSCVWTTSGRNADSSRRAATCTAGRHWSRACQTSFSGSGAVGGRWGSRGSAATVAPPTSPDGEAERTSTSCRSASVDARSAAYASAPPRPSGGRTFVTTAIRSSQVAHCQRTLENLEQVAEGPDGELLADRERRRRAGRGRVQHEHQPRTCPRSGSRRRARPAASSPGRGSRTARTSHPRRAPPARIAACRRRTLPSRRRAMPRRRRFARA